MKNAHQPLSHLTWVLGLEPRKLGGIERLCVEVAREARSRGVRLDFVFESEPAPVVALALKEQSASWHVVRRVGDLGLRQTIALSWYLWRSKPDAVHLHFCEFFVPFFVVARCLRVPLIGTYHVSGTPARLTSIRRVWKRLRKRLFKGSLIGITAVSESARRKFVSDYCECANRVTIVPNGIARAMRTLPSQAGTSSAPGPGAPRVIVVAALIPEKGVHIAIEALAAARRNLPHMTLTIVGDGPERSNLERLAATNGVAESVSFLGLRDDVPRLIVDHDIALVPSIWHEAFGFVILEAMAANCPVIASNIGGIPEIVRDGEDGLLVPPNDPDALAQAIARLWQAPDQRARFVASALARVDSIFCVDHIVAGYWAQYDWAFGPTNASRDQPTYPAPASSSSPQRPRRGAPPRTGDPARRTVLLLAYHFHPSNAIGARRCTAFAQQLASLQRPVAVISAFEGMDTPNARIDLDSLTLIPVAEPRNLMLDVLVRLNRSLRKNLDRSIAASAAPTSNPSSGLDRAFWSVVYIVDRHKKWSWRAAVAGVQAARENDAHVIVASGPPWSSLVAALWIATRTKLPLIVDFRDAWSDWVVNEAHQVPLSRALSRWLETMVLKRAAAVLCTAPALAGRLAERHPEVATKLHVVMNGYDGEPRGGSNSTGNRLAMLFAGELYVNRDPFPLLSALEEFLARPGIDQSRISLTFVGECSTYKGQRLDHWLRGKRCETVVQILPPVSANRVAEMVEASSLLINFAQGAPMMIPAKTFEHLARGREVLVFCEADSDTARIVAGISGVTRVDTYDFGAITAILTDLYHRHVVLNALTPPDPHQITRFSRRFQSERFTEILDSVCEQPVLATSAEH